MYVVRIATGTHGQSFLPDSYIRIVLSGTGQAGLLVNTGADIKTFLATTGRGVPVVEVSDCRSKVVDPAPLGLQRNSSDF